MIEDFQNELDALITKYKALDYDLGEMIADMSAAIDGLNDEIQQRDDEA